MSTNNGARIEIVKSPVQLDKMYVGENQKAGTITAQLRQQVVTHSFYPSKKVSSNMQDSLFGAKEFGFEEQQFTSTENRVAWILVPTSKTEAEVATMLAAAVKNGACIYRVLSNAPILDDNQQYAISAGLRSLDQFANTQAIRYPDGTTDELGTDIGGQLVLDKAGNVQYRRTFFSATPKEDIDERNTENVFQSAEIKAELQGAGALLGQNF